MVTFCSHRYPYDKVTLERDFDTSIKKGLTIDQAAGFLEQYGTNELTPPKHDSGWLRLIKSVFGGFFNILLWINNKRIELEPVNICELPADLRIVDCRPDTEADNSSLSGESEPQKREWKPSDETPAESANLCFFVTLVGNGKGTGFVIATGDETFMGRTAQLATSTEGEETPITKEIKGFVLKVSIIAFILGITFIIGMVEKCSGNIM